jgi:hypothetical protein
VAVADLDRVAVGVLEAEEVADREGPVLGLENDDALLAPLGQRLVDGFPGLYGKAQMVVPLQIHGPIFAAAQELQDEVRLAPLLCHQNDATPPSHPVVGHLQAAIAPVEVYARIQRVHVQGDVRQARCHEAFLSVQDIHESQP